MTGKVLIWGGAALAATMTILMIVGTTSLGAFIAWGVLLLVGLGAVGLGQRMESADRHRRLEAERHAARRTGLSD